MWLLDQQLGLVNQTMTGGADQFQIPQVVASAFASWHDMMDLQKAGVMAARCFTFMAGFGKNLPPDSRRDDGFVALTSAGNLVVALQLLVFQLSDFQFAFAGLDFG